MSKVLVVTSKSTLSKVSPLLEILQSTGWRVSLVDDLPGAADIRSQGFRLLISHHNGVILRQEHIDAVKGRCYNVHPSLLPLNRGASPIMWATLRSTVYGITIHQVTTGIDKGNPVWQQLIEIDENLSLAAIYSVHERVWYEALRQMTVEDRWREEPKDLLRPSMVEGPGTYHNRRQSETAFGSFSDGWETPAWRAREEYHARFGLA